MCRFTVNREVHLVGYGLPFWGKDRPESNITIKLTESADRIVLARNTAVMKRAANGEMFDMKFKKPVRLRTNMEYTTEFTSEVWLCFIVFILGLTWVGHKLF